jgi:hypothetical protein
LTRKGLYSKSRPSRRVVKKALSPLPRFKVAVFVFVWHTLDMSKDQVLTFLDSFDTYEAKFYWLTVLVNFKDVSPSVAGYVLTRKI